MCHIFTRDFKKNVSNIGWGFSKVGVPKIFPPKFFLILCIISFATLLSSKSWWLSLVKFTFGPFLEFYMSQFLLLGWKYLFYFTISFYTKLKQNVFLPQKSISGKTCLFPSIFWDAVIWFIILVLSKDPILSACTKVNLGNAYTLDILKCFVIF